jgi:hypothetical protein
MMRNSPESTKIISSIMYRNQYVGTAFSCGTKWKRDQRGITIRNVNIDHFYPLIKGFFSKHDVLFYNAIPLSRKLRQRISRRIWNFKQIIFLNEYWLHVATFKRWKNKYLCSIADI